MIAHDSKILIRSWQVIYTTDFDFLGDSDVGIVSFPLRPYGLIRLVNSCPIMTRYLSTIHYWWWTTHGGSCPFGMAMF